MKKLFIIILSVGLIFPFLVFARIGVGVGTGKIQLDQKLKAGLVYTLPNLPVINTGDEPFKYGVGVQYREGQKELKPKDDWFSFEPSEFYLEPGKVQNVKVKLTLPIKGVDPGDYFVFLQGFPIAKVSNSGASVNIAAASKLYFTVAPSSFFAGIYYRIISLFRLYAPWSWIISLIILAIALISYLRRFISFNVGVNFKRKNK